MLASFISSFIALIPVTIAQSLILSFVVLAIDPCPRRTIERHSLLT